MSRRVGLFLGVTPHMGGVFQYSQALLRAVEALPRERFDPVVCYTDPVWAEPLGGTGLSAFRAPAARWSLGLGVALTCSGLPVSWWRRLAAPLLDPLARRLRRERCELWVFTAYSCVCYQMPVPAVGIIHDLMHRYERRFPKDFPAGTYAWRERVFERMVRCTQALLVDSELGRRQVVESYGADPSRIQPLPFIASPQAVAAEPGDGFDKRVPLPQKFIFYPSRFWEHKNHARLIRAVGRLRRELPDIVLVLPGSQSRLHEDCLRLAAQLGLGDHIRFPGYVSQGDLAEMYRRALAMVMPTFFGPTNIPPLEAFALGCPVAVSDIYGMPEQVGDAALRFDPESVESIADAIRRLWTDDRLCAELVQRGRERAAGWGPEQFNARFHEIIDAVLATP